MAACGSLRHLFERPLQDNPTPTLMESLSWSHLKATKPPHDPAALTELFGELHFQERRSTDPPAQPPPPPDQTPDRRPPSSGGADSSLDALLGGGAPGNPHKSSARARAGIPPRGRSESLQMCTEGLGFESSDAVEDWGARAREAAGGARRRYARSRSDVGPRAKGGFPPPISCIGSGGKPSVCFRSYRESGRFVLREVRIPAQELLRVSREGGRLTLRFTRPREEAVDEGAEEGEEAERGRGEANKEEEIGV